MCKATEKYIEEYNDLERMVVSNEFCDGGYKHEVATKAKKEQVKVLRTLNAMGLKYEIYTPEGTPYEYVREVR